MNGMHRIKTFCLLLIAGLAAFTLSCESDELTEPAVYTPKQMRRLLTANNSKLWQQTTQHYLEDSCRTGFFVLFTENEKKDQKQPFYALFLRDFLLCDLTPDTIRLENHKEVVPKDTFLIKAVTGLSSPMFHTTDSLLFAGPEQDSIYYTNPENPEEEPIFLYATAPSDTTIRLIRLLTSQKLIMDVLGPENELLFREEYEAVEE